MKILMTADTIGGVWTYAIELAHALRPHGVDVVLATKGRRASAGQRAEAHEAGVELHESHYRLEWQDDPWEDVARASDWLLALAERVRPDVVHLNDYMHGALPFGAPVLMVAHSCVLSWFAAVKRHPAPETWDRYRREVTSGLRAAQVIVTATSAMRACVEEQYGPLARSRVIPNARRAALFRPLPKEPFVLAAGRLWDEAKNVAVLERVAPRLSLPVRVAGDEAAPDAGPIAPASARVERLGRLETAELARWMGRATLYALPARYEPFGLTALEAALSGCALILGDIPSLQEIWGDAALYVPPDDDDALASAIETLTRDSARRRVLAHRSRTRALRHSPDAFGAAYYDCYTGLIEREARHGGAPCAW